MALLLEIDGTLYTKGIGGLIGGTSDYTCSFVES